MRPQTTALLDQADAATAQASKIMGALASMEGTPVVHREPGLIFRAIIGGMQQRAMAGQLTLCLHLSYAAPEPAFWCAWAPGRLRCVACAHETNKRIRGSREDRRCDHCRAVGPKIHADMAQLPAIVVDLPPWPPGCVPPVTLMFGLCPACQRADKE
jgi:hypothetical protein